MHIIAGFVLAVVAGIGIWYWRVKALHEAGSDAADLVGRMRGAYRMKKFRDKAEASVLTTIEHPAMAAAVYLHVLAAESGAGPQGDDKIRREIAAVVPAGELDEMLAYAQWASRSVVDSKDVVRRFKLLWRDRLDPDERGELLRMAREVVSLAPAPEPGHRLALQTLQLALDA